MIRGSLFSKGYWTGQPSLSDVLDHHKAKILERVRAVTDMDQLTEPYVANLVKDSLVEPLHLHFEKTTHKPRSEEFDGSDFPDQFSFNVYRGKRYAKTVARISIPFTGDGKLLEYTPNSASFNYPRGEVSGRTIHYDVVFWGHHDDNERVAKAIQENRETLETFVANTNGQVRAFNDSLFGEVKPVFEAKLDQLTRQLSVFDALGIKEQADPVHPVVPPAALRPRKTAARASQIIQIVENQYVRQLTQINNNDGDVNNAIQSS